MVGLVGRVGLRTVTVTGPVARRDEDCTFLHRDSKRLHHLRSLYFR